MAIPASGYGIAYVYLGKELGVFAAGAAALTRREQWNEGILPSARTATPRSQVVPKSDTNTLGAFNPAGRQARIGWQLPRRG